MNAIQQKVFELLEEFDRICSENDIDYCLGPFAVSCSLLYGTFHENDPKVDVVMMPDDVSRFIKYMNDNGMPGRSIEYMGNYGRYLSFNLSYVNDETTFFDLKRGYDFSHNGVRLDIEIIRSAKKKNNVLMAIEHGLEVSGYRLTTMLSLSTAASFAFANVLKVIGRARLNRKMFSVFMNAYKTTGRERTFIRPFKNRVVYFEKNMFNNLKSVRFNGKSFPAPEKTERYLVDFFGANWRNIVENDIYNNKFTVAMSDLPYAEFADNMKNEGIDISHALKEQRKSLTDAFFSFRHLRNKDMSWLIAQRSGDRLELYEELMSKRELINNLHNNNDYEELNRVFAKHEEKTRYYYNHGLGLCVSKDFFELQCELLERRGQHEFVEELKKMIPERHLKPIIDI